MKYLIDQYNEYISLIKDKEIFELPAGVPADKLILCYAIAHPLALIVSNDLFRSYYPFLPGRDWIKKRRITVMKVNKEVFFLPMMDGESSKNFLKIKSSESVVKSKSKLIEYKKVMAK